jgi:predicted GNAT superfamily acetyltransferase
MTPVICVNISIRPLNSPKELLQAEKVQLEAWGMTERMVTPKDIMKAILSNGGLVLGAFDGERMVGMALSFLGSKAGKLYMYSHQTGVVKDYQSRGVGYMLKLEQKKYARDSGFDLIAWTFDPLITRNLHFNLNKLGVIFRNYYVDYYGPMEDTINYGWPTDRVLAEWFLGFNRPPSWSMDVSKAEEPFRPVKKTHKDGIERCADWSIDLDVRTVLVDIPRDILKVKERSREEANRWREATREVYTKYFNAGFSAVFLSEKEPACRLERAELPPNIFGE